MPGLIGGKYGSSYCSPVDDSTHGGNTSGQYNFQDRKGSLCVSSREYRKCSHECFVKYSKKTGGCRLPFQPTEAKLEECTYNTNQSLVGLDMFLRGLTNYHCSCTRKCNYKIFESVIESMEKYSNQTVHVLDFGTSYVTVIKERFIYTVGNLLADIGGNSGLWIGISVLSVFDFLPLPRKTKKKQQFISTCDPLYRIVLKRMNKDKQLMNYSIQLKNSGNSIINIAKPLFYGFTCLLFAFAVFNRTIKFFQFPLRNVVEISFLQTIKPPSLTICSGESLWNTVRTMYAAHNNISDSCELKLWHLQVISNYSLTELEAKRRNFYWASATPEYLYDGVCFNTMKTMKPINARSKNWIYADIDSQCGQNYLKLYIKSANGFYDYTLYRYIFLNSKNTVSYTIKKIGLNMDNKDCTSEKEHEKCKAICLQGKLGKSINCRLPFMDYLHLPPCQSLSSVDHSLKVYIDLFVLPENSADCKCPPPCYKSIYETEVSSEYKGFLGSTLGFGLKRNVMETYTKVRVYPLVALLCDIGGLLGSTIGLCIFSAFDHLLKGSLDICKRFHQIKKRK